MCVLRTICSHDGDFVFVSTWIEHSCKAGVIVDEEKSVS